MFDVGLDSRFRGAAQFDDADQVSGLVGAWLAPTLLNGWTEVPGSPVRFCKDSMGFVHFKGRLNTAASYVTIMNMPAGYRPAVWTTFYMPRGDNAASGARFTVHSSSAITCDVNIVPATTIDLTQICYMAEA